MMESVAKIFCWCAALTAVIAVGPMFLLDRPPAFAFEQAVNHYYRQGEGTPRKIAEWLIQSNLARDWASPEEVPAKEAPYPLLLHAASNRFNYPYQSYSSSGRPIELKPGQFLPPQGTRVVGISTAAQLTTAISAAQPGDIITMAPGAYNLKARSIPVRADGLAERPIYVRAETFGTVLVNLDALEGFHVMAPFWVFENLRVRGVCKDDTSCEHAFHVVGNGKSFTLRNSEIFNFNAPIKVNLQRVGGTDHYADNGLLEYNSFYNEAPRHTSNPVTLLNIDSADGWVVRGNYIADFAKAGGDHISYAAFMKGNARDGVFERNLVICEHRLPADAGTRVGLSFGGGGTETRFCKGQNCAVEFSDGIMRNNIIMNCSHDVGIYLNRAARSQIYHNLLYNNLGIDVRFNTSSANITNNIISGRISNRDKGHSTEADNVIARDCLGSARVDCELNQIYQAPDQADFRLKSLDNQIWKSDRPAPGETEDLCGHPLPEQANIGPIQYLNGLKCLAMPKTKEAGRG